MHALATIDYAIIISFLTLSLVAGVIMTKRASTSLDHYFLGGRTLPWYLLGVAGMANWFDLTGTAFQVTGNAGWINSHPAWHTEMPAGYEAYSPLIMAEPTQFMLMTAISFVGTIVGSLITAPTSREVLVNFYRTTRPFGWWWPLRGEFQGAGRAAIDRENLTDILTLPFALIWLVSMLLLPMQLVIKAYSAFFWTLPLFLFGLAGMYVFWWKPLMKK